MTFPVAEMEGEPFGFALDGEPETIYLCTGELTAEALGYLADTGIGHGIRFVRACLEPESRVVWDRRLKRSPVVSAKTVDTISAALMREYFGMSEGESED